MGLQNKMDALERDKENLVNDLEDCKAASSKLDQALEKGRLHRTETENEILQLRENLKRGKYSDLVTKLIAILETTITNSTLYEPAQAAGALTLSDELLSKVNALLEAASAKPGVKIEEAKSLHQKTMEMVAKNEEHDPRIPREFLLLAAAFLEKASQAKSEGQETLAMGYADCARDLNNKVRTLYDNQETSRLLRIFRRG
jgi:hypothetical protein